MQIGLGLDSDIICCCPEDPLPSLGGWIDTWKDHKTLFQAPQTFEDKHDAYLTKTAVVHELITQARVQI
jgi:hypothetical protein